MTKLHALAGVGVAAAAGLVPLVGWALDVTDEAAVIEAFLDHTGMDMNPGDVCVLTDPDFPGVAVVGTFAHDRGCITQIIHVDGDWLMPSLASAAALRMAGWQGADDDGRARLALLWTAFGGFPFSSPVTSPNEDFGRPGGPAFVPPRAEPAAAGAVVTLWVEEPSGMAPETEYNLWELTYDRDGKTVRIRVLDSFTADF